MASIAGLTANFGTTSAEKRGPKSAVKCEIVLKDEEILTPTANLSAIPGKSGTMTVLVDR